MCSCLIWRQMFLCLYWLTVVVRKYRRCSSIHVRYCYTVTDGEKNEWKLYPDVYCWTWAIGKCLTICFGREGLARCLKDRKLRLFRIYLWREFLVSFSIFIWFCLYLSFLFTSSYFFYFFILNIENKSLQVDELASFAHWNSHIPHVPTPGPLLKRDAFLAIVS